MIQCRRYLAASYVFVVVSRIRCSVAGMLQCRRHVALSLVCMYVCHSATRTLQCRRYVAVSCACCSATSMSQYLGRVSRRIFVEMLQCREYATVS